MLDIISEAGKVENYTPQIRCHWLVTVRSRRANTIRANLIKLV